MLYVDFVDIFNNIIIKMIIINHNCGDIRGAHRSLSQSRDDVSQGRQRLVDVLCLIQNSPGSSGLTDLKKEQR